MNICAVTREGPATTDLRSINSWCDELETIVVIWIVNGRDIEICKAVSSLEFEFSNDTGIFAILAGVDSMDGTIPALIKEHGLGAICINPMVVEVGIWGRAHEAKLVIIVI